MWEKPKPKTLFKVESMRFYGEPKLSKPLVLKGIKQVSSIPFIRNKATCSVFVKDNDVYIKHVDYFSSEYKPTYEESGMKLNYFTKKFFGKDRPKKFIYDDAWGSVILRNEAWLKLENLVLDIKNKVFLLDIKNSILRQMEEFYNLEYTTLHVGTMERFMENVVRELNKHFEVLK